jgi:putative cardiolipin synthase
VRVRILTNSLASTDVPLVHAGYARYRPQMLACGIELHELRPGVASPRTRIGLSSGASLHSKAVVVDGELVFIGSMNLDPRSRHLNSELALRIDSRTLGRQMTTLFDDATTLDQAYRVGLDEPGNAKAALHWDAVVDGRPIRYTDEPLASAWRRWFVRLLGRLAPEDLL